MEDSFIKQMAEIKDKADRYDHLKRRFDDIVEKLKQLNNQIYGIMIEAKPEVKILERQNRIRQGDAEVLEWAVKYMNFGKYLNLKELCKAFPDRTEGSLSQIFYMKIPKIPKVLSTKLDNTKNFYFQNEE